MKKVARFVFYFALAILLLPLWAALRIADGVVCFSRELWRSLD